MALDFNLAEIEEFEWDEGNLNKNRLKHGVQAKECEEVFLNLPLRISEDIVHSQTEKRFQAIGKTNGERLIFVVFTIRKNKMRIISARDQSKKERELYSIKGGGAK